jgi:hypothetical protein
MAFGANEMFSITIEWCGDSCTEVVFPSSIWCSPLLFSRKLTVLQLLERILAFLLIPYNFCDWEYIEPFPYIFTVKSVVF